MNFSYFKINMWLLQKIKKIQISIKEKIRITKSVSTPIPIPQNLKLEVATRRPKVSNISDIKLSYETDHKMQISKEIFKNYIYNTWPLSWIRKSRSWEKCVRKLPLGRASQARGHSESRSKGPEPWTCISHYIFRHIESPQVIMIHN